MTFASFQAGKLYVRDTPCIVEVGSKKDPLHALPHSIGRQLFRMVCFSEDLKALGTGNRCNICTKTEVLKYLGVNIWSFWAAMNPKLIQNGSETNHLKHLSGLRPEIAQNGTKTYHSEHTGTMGPIYV